MADALDTLGLSVGTNIMYDSNVFRLSPLINPVSILGQPTRSDLIITSSAVLNFNKNYGMQRFEGNGSIVDNRYQNFDFLNFIGKNYTVAWHWYATPYLHGKISSNRREALNNFADLTGFINSNTRNLRTSTNHRFDGIFEITPALHIVGGVSQSMSRNTRLLVQDFDNKVLSVEGGIRYLFSSGTSATYKIRSGDGDFFKRPQPLPSSLFDNGFRQLEHEFHLIWPLTPQMRAGGRIAYLTRKHDHFSQRDFSGIVGNIDLNWQITGKTHLQASFARELASFQTSVAFQLLQFQRFSSSYMAINRFSLMPIWQMSAKTMLRLRYDYSTRDFLGGVSPIPLDRRSDSQHSGSIMVDWRPIDMLSISATLQRDHRSSNLETYKYDNTAVMFATTFNF